MSMGGGDQKGKKLCFRYFVEKKIGTVKTKFGVCVRVCASACLSVDPPTN